MQNYIQRMWLLDYPSPSLPITITITPTPSLNFVERSTSFHLCIIYPIQGSRGQDDCALGGMAAIECGRQMYYMEIEFQLR